jgi:hypothetical protein
MCFQRILMLDRKLKMFIVKITYTADITKIDAVLAQHRSWLDIQYQKGQENSNISY